MDPFIWIVLKRIGKTGKRGVWILGYKEGNGWFYLKSELKELLPVVKFYQCLQRGTRIETNQRP